MTKTAILSNSRWRTAAIWKIALSKYRSRELSDFDEIWYGDANFHSENGHLTKNRIFFSNSRWRKDVMLEIIFFAISPRHIGRLTRNSDQRWRITCRYRWLDQNGNCRKFKMAGGRHFENSFSVFRHVRNPCISVGVLASIKSWKQQLSYRKTARSLFTFL